MKKASKKGLLIGVEGIDAAGKRTQTSLLAAWLRKKGVSVHTASFPEYGTTIGREIKAFLNGKRKYSAEVRHILFAANRWENNDKLESMLTKFRAVIVNRYTESNLAYGIANGLSLDWLTNLESGLPKTDLVIVLDAPPSVLYSRRNSAKDRYERSAQIQAKAREAYEELAVRFGWKVINASRGIDATHHIVVAEVSHLISSRQADATQ